MQIFQQGSAAGILPELCLNVLQMVQNKQCLNINNPSSFNLSVGVENQTKIIQFWINCLDKILFLIFLDYLSC